MATHQPGRRHISGHDIAVCSLVHFYVTEAPLNEAGPLLTRLLVYTSRLIFETDGQATSLANFIDLLTAALSGSIQVDEENAIANISRVVTLLVRSASSLSGLHTFFTGMERLLLREEVYDELQDITIRAPDRQIDESSPFGRFLHKCLDTYFALEDDEFSPILLHLSKWISGDQGAVIPQRESNDHILARSMAQGDYSASRSILEGSFSEPPLPSSGLQSTLSSILLKNAQFHLETLAFEKAREALEEALRLARGVNDMQDIAACDDLLRKIKLREGGHGSSYGDQSFTGPITSLNDIEEARKYVRSGMPLTHVLRSTKAYMASLRKDRSSNGLQDDGAAIRQAQLLESELWQMLGSHSNAVAIVHHSYAPTDALSTKNLTRGATSVSTMLQAKVRTATLLAQAGRVKDAIWELLDVQLLCAMDIDTLQNWHANILTILYRASKQCELTATANATVAIRPEVKDEVEGSNRQMAKKSAVFNEASFGRRADVSVEQVLRGQLLVARELCNSSVSASSALQIAIETGAQADQSDLLSLKYEAVCLSAEALVNLQMPERAKATLESILPALLSGNDVETRANACFVYAKVLMAKGLLLSSSELPSVWEEALPWLERASKDCSSGHLSSLFKTVLYTKARLLHTLQRYKERDEVSQQCLDLCAEDEFTKTVLTILDDIQEIVALTGARVVSGA